MPLLEVARIVKTGYSTALISADEDGDTFVNDGKTFLRVGNGGAVPVTVTIKTQIPSGIACQGYGILGDSDIAVVIPAGENRDIGVFEQARYNNSDGQVEVEYSVFASVGVKPLGI